MKHITTLIAIAVVCFFAGSASGGFSTAPTSSPNVTVQDTWGASFAKNYHACDAVALVLIHGIRDTQTMPDGTLAISLGLTGVKQGVEVNIDGTHNYCARSIRRPR